MLKTLDRVFHRLSAPQVYSLFLKERRRIPKTIPVCMLALLNTVLAESTLIYQGHLILGTKSTTKRGTRGGCSWAIDHKDHRNLLELGK